MVGNLPPCLRTLLIEQGEDLHRSGPQIGRPAVPAGKRVIGQAANFGQILHAGLAALVPGLCSDDTAAVLAESVVRELELFPPNLADALPAERQLRMSLAPGGGNLLVGPAQLVMPANERLEAAAEGSTLRQSQPARRLMNAAP